MGKPTDVTHPAPQAPAVNKPVHVHPRVPHPMDTPMPAPPKTYPGDTPETPADQPDEVKSPRPRPWLSPAPSGYSPSNASDGGI